MMHIKHLNTFLYFFKHRYLFFFILRFTRNNSFFSHLNRLNKFTFFIILFTFIINRNNRSYYLGEGNITRYYSILSKKLHLPHYTFNNTDIYFFWSSFNTDPLIQLFLNVIMKEGKKYVSYKLIYKIFFFIKKLTGIFPLLVLKKCLYSTRFLFDIQTIKLRKKIITLPKVLSLKSQFIKSIKYILNVLKIKHLKVNKYKSFLSCHKKISYLILNNLFFNNRLKKLILHESYLVKNNFHHISKEVYQKIASQRKILLKVRLFKKKYKAYSKKDKILNEHNKKLYFLKKGLSTQKNFLSNRYQLNLQSKIKLKSKWF